MYFVATLQIWLAIFMTANPCCPTLGLDPQLSYDIPRLEPVINMTTGRPNCAGERDVMCEYTDEYPYAYVRALVLNLQDCGLTLGMFGSRDKRQIEDIEPICSQFSRAWIPKVALTIGGKWKYVVQDSEAGFAQVFNSETCRFENANCVDSDIGLFPRQCRTVYNNVQMFAIDSTSLILPRANMDTFRFPSCCKCFQENTFNRK